LKVSADVKIARQCFENFGGGNAPNIPPGYAPVLKITSGAINSVPPNKFVYQSVKRGLLKVALDRN